MKTVIDAVNEFKGVSADFDWDEYRTNEHCYIEVLSIAPDINKPRYIGQIVDGGTRFDINYSRLVCTREEFNQCVDEMSNNFGTGSQLRLHKWQIEHSLEFRVIPFDDKPVKPVYTQEMHEAGEVALIGMEVNHFSKIMTVIAKPDADGYFPALNEKGTYTIVLATDCLPPTPPKTDTEKAYDDLREYFNRKEVWTHQSLLNAIKSNHIHGVTFTGES